MKKLILLLIVALLATFLAATALRACDSDWGNDQDNENNYE
jgi:hypothetical protein